MSAPSHTDFCALAGVNAWLLNVIGEVSGVWQLTGQPRLGAGYSNRHVFRAGELMNSTRWRRMTQGRLCMEVFIS